MMTILVYIYNTLISLIDFLYYQKMQEYIISNTETALLISLPTTQFLSHRLLRFYQSNLFHFMALPLKSFLLLLLSTVVQSPSTSPTAYSPQTTCTTEPLHTQWPSLHNAPDTPYPHASTCPRNQTRDALQ